MAKLVTPSPNFFVNTLYDSETSPSYTTRVMQKHNRPWLLFQLDTETSIMVPNRSGAGFENYNQYVVLTPDKDSHLAYSGFDIPNALIIRGYEHRDLNDWEDLNPDKSERAEDLKGVIPQVAKKTKDFIKEFSNFSQQTTNADFVDELPKMFNPDFKIYSNAPIQFKQQYIPAKFTDNQRKLGYPMSFNEYPQTIKDELSDANLDLAQTTPFVDPADSENKVYTPITNVTPLQAKFSQTLESQQSPKQFEMKSWLHNNIKNDYASVHEYIFESRRYIQNEWDTSQMKFDKNPADKKESRILNESAKKDIPGRRISAQDSLEP